MGDRTERRDSRCGGEPPGQAPLRFEEALELDRLARNSPAESIKAADAYEAVIRCHDAPLDAFINLAGLYWEATDPGATSLSHEFFLRAASRYIEVLDEAERRFGPRSQILFWRCYIRYISLGGPEFDDEALRWLREGHAPSAIYVYLYPALHDSSFVPAMKQALIEANANPTVLNGYVSRVLDNCLQSAAEAAAA